MLSDCLEGQLSCDFFYVKCGAVLSESWQFFAVICTSMFCVCDYEIVTVCTVFVCACFRGITARDDGRWTLERGQEKNCK